MSSAVTVRHNFETGHRLPILGGKCENLHGHSWWAEITVEAPDDVMCVVEFGAFKAAVREWIDRALDHGLMLGADDPLARILPEFGKVFIFTEEQGAGTWPTVENVARLLALQSERLLGTIHRSPGTHVTRVDVSETHVNRASWIATHTPAVLRNASGEVVA